MWLNDRHLHIPRNRLGSIGFEREDNGGHLPLLLPILLQRSADLFHFEDTLEYYNGEWGDGEPVVFCNLHHCVL